MDESIPALKSTQAAPSDIIREKRYGCDQEIRRYSPPQGGSEAGNGAEDVPVRTRPGVSEGGSLTLLFKLHKPDILK